MFIIIIIINNNHHNAMTLQSKIGNRQPVISEHNFKTLTYEITLFIAVLQIQQKRIHKGTEMHGNTCYRKTVKGRERERTID